MTRRQLQVYAWAAVVGVTAIACLVYFPIALLALGFGTVIANAGWVRFEDASTARFVKIAVAGVVFVVVLVLLAAVFEDRPPSRNPNPPDRDYHYGP